jgi:hypothetical protein
VKGEREEDTRAGVCEVRAAGLGIGRSAGEVLEHVPHGAREIPAHA